MLNNINVYGSTPYRNVTALVIIVLSHNSNPQTRCALKSIFSETASTSICIEVVVVNTGFGSLAELLFDYLDRITLIESSVLLNAGGARNLGIKYSRSEIICFLAADCLITKNWINHQIYSHKKYDMVASALRPALINNKHNKICWACYILIHFSRMPEMEPHKAGLYGVSYKRKIFYLFGDFDVGLRIGEDTVFNDNVKKSFPILWCPQIVTLHRYPSGFFDALMDLYSRAGRDVAFLKRNKKSVYYGFKRGLKMYWHIFIQLIYSKRKIFHPNVRHSILLALLLMPAYFFGVFFRKNGG